MSRQRPTDRSLPAAGQRLLQEPQKGGLMNPNEMMEKLGLSKEEMAELLALFVDSCRNDLEQMSTALAAEDARGVSEAAHSIKGAAGNMRFEQLYEMARSIEEDARQRILDGVQARIEQIGSTIENIARDFRASSG
jgi:HPt (histidine-containing phosphotransfer) domain-containing protein